MKNKFENTSFTKIHNVKEQINKAIIFLKKHNECVLNTRNKNIFFKKKTLVENPAKVITNYVVQNDLTGLFELIDLSNINSDSIPDVFNISDIPIIHNNKVIVNITPFIKKKKFSDDDVEINNLDAFHELIMKYTLFLSYETFLNNKNIPMWLEKSILKTIVQSYNMIITSTIRLLNNVRDIEMVRMLFAWFYFTRLYKFDQDEFFSPFILTQLKINLSKIEMENILNEFLLDYKITEPMTIVEFCQRLIKLIPILKDRFNEYYLMRSFSISHNNSTELMIAIEYPPYWVSHLLKIVGGNKDWHRKPLNTFKLMSDVEELISLLLKSRLFLSTLEGI
jgi:hypothetical protein